MTDIDKKSNFEGSEPSEASKKSDFEGASEVSEVHIEGCAHALVLETGEASLGRYWRDHCISNGIIGIEI